MDEWIAALNRQALLAWIRAYSRPLIMDVLRICEPERVMWHDMSRSTDGKASADTCVASFDGEGYEPEGHWQHRADA